MRSSGTAGQSGVGRRERRGSYGMAVRPAMMYGVETETMSMRQESEDEDEDEDAKVFTGSDQDE